MVAHRLRPMPSCKGDFAMGNYGVGNCRNVLVLGGVLQDLIEIRAQAKRGALASIAVGCSGLLVGALLLMWLPELLRLVAIFAISVGLVGLLLGWFKLREPKHSLVLSKTHIIYYHRLGQWQTHWSNIARIDVPQIHIDLEYLPLAVVGIRLRSYEPLLNSMSPRLMNNMMLEQRSLLLQALKGQKEQNSEFDDHLLEADKFTSEDGKVYRGLQAMFANRMSKLRNSLGYDIFINAAELDRPPTEFVTLLRQCQQIIDNEVENTQGGG